MAPPVHHGPRAPWPAAIAAGLLACGRAEPFESCTDDLHGVYLTDGGARWNVLDNRASLEAYPMFDDTASPPAGLEIAPRVIDLRRIPDGLAGEVTRRYMKGAARCDAKANARVVACKANILEIVLAEPLAPIEFSPCVWGQAPSSRREKWTRE